MLFRSGIANIARNEGIEVVGEASNKEEALALLAATTPDVVTVDLSLPDGSGLEIVKFARKNSQRIGIVVISILDDDSHLIACMNAGASGFVSKTSNLDLWIDKYNDMISYIEEHNKLPPEKVSIPKNANDPEILLKYEKLKALGTWKSNNVQLAKIKIGRAHV